MKKVFNNAELAHVWAQQKQSSGRGSHFFFEGPTIFSYGSHFPIARFIDDDTVLLTTQSYSVTTARHIGMTRRAVFHKTVIDVHDVIGTDGATHTANVLDLMKRITDEVARIRRARTGFSWAVGNLEHRIDNLRAYFTRFRKKIEPKTRKEVSRLLKQVIFTEEELTGFNQREFDHNQKRDQADETRRAKQIKQATADLEKWKAGEPSYSSFYLLPVVLRLHGEEIQTSHGASIPVSVGIKLWKRMTGTNGGAPVVGTNLGHYTVDSWDGETLKAGCHTIPKSEIQRMAVALGLVGVPS
jgi:hypothetical protein